MANPTAPNLASADGGFVIAFEPESHWVAGAFDPATLIAALKAQPGLADFNDEQGNPQSAIRLDADIDPANVGYWITIPADSDKAAIDAAVAAYKPPPEPAPPLPPVQERVADVITNAPELSDDTRKALIAALLG